MKCLALSMTALSMAAASAGLASAADCDLLKFANIATQPTSAACSKAASGYSPISATSPTAAQLTTMCRNADCAGMMQDLNSAFPTDCTLPIGAGNPLVRATIINKFLSTCAAPAASASGIPCGSDQAGVKACPANEHCQPWNPSYYQCRRLRAYCGTQQVGIDFYGDDLAKYQLLLPEDCCNKCATTAGCKGYTFVNNNPDGKAYCYLKKGGGARTNKVGVVSAMMR